ncbi:MAG: alpha amylase C-terminal domain-containing protein [Bacteroidota bacterium]|nr:alpha amylase C-terminal domain-containing protein [Bacteroidota bacterium]
MSFKIPLTQNDSYLKPFEEAISKRIERVSAVEKSLTGPMSLSEFATGYLHFGLHYKGEVLVYNDWLPASDEVWLVGDFSGWERQPEYKLKPTQNGEFSLRLPKNSLKHKDLYRLVIRKDDNYYDRIPAYARRVVRDNQTGIFNAQVWLPESPYIFRHELPKNSEAPFIYEAHIGMASEEGKVSNFTEFKDNVLPRISHAGYNTIQLMAVQEHPYYGSFGYHVSSYFAVTHLFGTPEELKALIDEAHKLGIRVIMDIVHSHSVKNEVEGLSKYDGTEYQYFHKGERGMHPAWDSRCFDYGKHDVLHFLLSNCKFWLEEYNFDGFRFDGVTSMLYLDHGLGTDFMGYEQYYDNNRDEDAIVYLNLANKLIHELKPQAISIAEEMSGMPGLASPLADGGYGFDYRLAMGIPDFWVKVIKEQKDEDWHVGNMFHRLTDKRNDEQVISYAESHDQALVGDKTIIFRLADADMYEHMHINKLNLNIERSLALHMIIRLFTASLAEGGYLNFMGNEFGHPEWIDFPRDGNNWSYHYARRQWSLADNQDLVYRFLSDFDKRMVDFLRSRNILQAKTATALVQDNYKQVLAYERNQFIFIINFNPFESFTDYEIPASKGKYRIILNTDSAEFMGHNRIDDSMLYESAEAGGHPFLKLYLPTRTAVIIEKDD